MELAERPKLRRIRSGTAVLDKGRRRGEAILDAATRLLIEEGYAQLSTRKIAARAGMHPGNLQYYYRTKADVVRALLERYLDDSLRAIEARIAAAGGSPAARLRATVEGILDDQDRAAACRMFWEIWALAARDAAVARAAAAFYARYRDGLAAALLAAAPRLGRARAARRAALLVALFEGLTVWRLGGGRTRPDPALLRELRAVLPRLTEEDR
jgi:AcrR family transcriptional regulator